MPMRALAVLLVALTALLSPAAAGDVTWISPVLGNSCNKTCTAGNVGQPPEMWLIPVYSNGRELCRLQDDGRTGNVLSIGPRRGCYVPNSGGVVPSASDLCPKRSPDTPYECGCQSYDKTKRPTWVAYDGTASKVCADPVETWSICRVKRRTTPGPGINRYGIGTFKMDQTVRCEFNHKPKKDPPQPCAYTSEFGIFDILCLELKP